MAGRDALEPNAETQPPHRQLAQAVEGVRGRERHAVVGPDGLRQAELLKGAFEDAERIALLRRGQRFTGEQVAGGVVGDRQRIAIPLIAEQKLALVVGAPEPVGLADRGERGAGQARPPAAPPVRDQAVAIEHGVDGADGRARDVRPALTQPLPNLGRAPRRAVSLQPHDAALRPRPAADSRADRAGGSGHSARAPRSADTAERSCSRSCGRYRTPRTGSSSPRPSSSRAHEPDAFIHHVTLLPRHAPSC